jgi:hypothetical protein
LFCIYFHAQSGVSFLPNTGSLGRVPNLNFVIPTGGRNLLLLAASMLFGKADFSPLKRFGMTNQDTAGKRLSFTAIPLPC